MTANPKTREASATSTEIAPASALPPRLLRLPEVMSRVGLRRSAIYQRMSEGRFPKCRSLGPKCSVWVEAEINAWIDSIARSPCDGLQQSSSRQSGR
ncbi:prophage regulatory protein [Erythromicrobium ramosum]|uniref:Prophage regulatory protein n=1 Tax=Erythrobacter ramosus TaxID=35811 RepID=A0ABR6I236_9SPHN|nr:AlpA family phage regulatory protein [Erythrobacter ramosus]MBB3776977.1 prophage regulatory protein [Erythrobacter ramosus]